MTHPTQLSSLIRLSLLVLLTVVLAPHVLHGRSTTLAPLLPPPTGTVIYVSTEPQLQAAVLKLASNTTLILAPGTYVLTSTLYLNGSLTNVTIRGGTDSRDDVVLQGPGMTNASYGSVPDGIWIGGQVQGFTIANLTIRDLYYSAIMFNAGTESPHVYNVHLLDTGRPFITSSPDGVGGGVDNGIVEYSVIEYTTTAKDANTNGIDVHTGANWIIRHNLFRNIVAPAGELAGPAVQMWDSSINTLTEGNTFLDCAREISYGFVNRDGGFDHSGGVIRNNFMYRSGARSGDVAISIADSPNTQVLNNTIYLSGTYATPIEYRFAGTTGVLVANNLLDGFPWARDGATGSEQNNLSGATANMFVNAAAGDLHLSASATTAIDHGVPLANVTDDWDGQSRPSGAAPDIGADEFVSDTTTPTAPATSSANVGAGVAASAIAPMAVAPVTASIWSESATPGRIETVDANAVEVGVRFRADTNGTITGVRFYKGASNTGTHIGNLWTNAGTLLATGVFSNETASGWQQMTFSSAVAITANTTYVASYHTNVGQYGADNAYFATTGVDNAPLHALADGVDGMNGVYVYSASAFPTQTYGASNYWVDVVFTASGGGDTTAPTVSITTPANGATVSGSAVTVSATAADNVGVVGVQFKLDGANLGAEDTASPYTFSWNTTTTANGNHTWTAVARDAAGNTTTSTAVTVTVNNGDITAPTVSITTPANNATVSGSAVTVSATAADNVGVVGVQFKLDGANLGAEDTASPYTFSWNTSTTANGSHAVTAVARDAAGNTATSAAVTVVVSNAAALSTIWSASATPSRIETVDTNAVEVGVRFRADTDGAIMGVRFYKGTGNTGTHIGNLWTNAGTLLATATFSNETASGWQQLTFSSAVAITANTTYVASYHTNVGQYGADNAYFATTGFDNAPLHALADGVSGANSVYAYGASAFPTQTYQSSNYWVDVVFRASGGGGDTTAPTVAITAPASGATVSGSAVTVSATASDNVGVVGVQLKLDGANLGTEDTASPYSNTWNTTTAVNGTHTLTAVARDAAGNTTTSAGVTVTVSNAGSTPPTTVIFQASTDHNNGVTSYLLEAFANGADPNTASPVASSDLGKPTPAANGDITVDRTSFFSVMARGTYVMTVSAIGPTGQGRSAPVTVTW
jgi:uncharacterized protein DUF4082/Big-like domain-containing protein